MDIDEIFAFYRCEFIPAYSDLVGYIGDKPRQVLIELENVLSHLSQNFNPKVDQKDKAKNLQMAYDHFVRATLDCYKLLWVNLHDQLKMIEADESVRKLGLNISEAEFLMALQKIRKLAQEARSIELESVGLDPMASIDKYKAVVQEGYRLIEKKDKNKIKDIKSLKGFISIKGFITGMVIGVFAGVISGYLLLFI
ncbi:MAG: hypothetical protein H0M93_01955 [Methanophagales archaeon]|nr:hypothetical protein [Methanophagales archaeon]